MAKTTDLLAIILVGGFLIFLLLGKKAAEALPEPRATGFKPPPMPLEHLTGRMPVS